jgi:excisionase family DNA binding protein
MSGGDAVVSFDGDLTWTTWNTAEAADAAGVSRDVIYAWVHRGKLKPVRPTGRPRYKALDVLRVEAETRQRAGRAYAAAS